MHIHFRFYFSDFCAVIVINALALTLLVGWQEGHLACIKDLWVVECWHGICGARRRLECGLADATATHCLLLQIGFMVYLSGVKWVFECMCVHTRMLYHTVSYSCCFHYIFTGCLKKSEFNEPVLLFNFVDSEVAIFTVVFDSYCC